MPYERTVWQTGDVITAEKLNNLEDGCGCFLVTVTVHQQEESIVYTCDKTLEEILSAWNGGLGKVLIREQTVDERYSEGDVISTTDYRNLVSVYIRDDRLTYLSVFELNYHPMDSSPAAYIHQYAFDSGELYTKNQTRI